MDDVRHKAAVEGGALLLAGGVDLGSDIGDGEDVAPEGFVVGLVLWLYVFEEFVHVIEDVLLLNRTQFWACGFGGH